MNRSYVPMKGGMVEYQLNRRVVLQIAPESLGRGVETKGIGSEGNTSHLNLTRPLPVYSIPEPKPNPLLAGPVSRKDRQIVQLAMAGNDADKIAWVLGAEVEEVIHVMEKYGLQSLTDGVS